MMRFMFYTCAAAPNFAKNIGTWLLENLKWGVIIVAAFVILKLFATKSWAQIVVTVLVAGVVFFFMANPDSLSTIGDWLGGLILSGQ